MASSHMPEIEPVANEQELQLVTDHSAIGDSATGDAEAAVTQSPADIERKLVKQWPFWISASAVILIAVIASGVLALWPSDRRVVIGTTGAVAADNSLCSAIGVDILRQGGNAVDAAIAVGFCQGVVSPFASGIGGGGFMVLRLPNGTAAVIDFREFAPAAANRTMYFGRVSASLKGGLAAGVPAEVAGYALAHRLYGRLPWATLLAPSIRYARDGYPAGEELAKRLLAAKADVLASPGLAAIFAPGGVTVAAGQIVRWPQLADTLQDVAEQGAAGFYTGLRAQQMVDTINANGGNMTLEDLASYRAQVREPVEGYFHGYRILTTPPATSGGLVLVNALNIMERYTAVHATEPSAAIAHDFIEALKFSFALRNQLGDPSFVDVAPAQRAMLDKATAGFERSRISSTVTYPTWYYDPANYSVLIDHGTCHWSVVDSDRMAVAVTSTVNTLFGSKLVCDGCGVIFNNQMNDFNVDPETPNAFGLVQSSMNDIAPFKRPLSSTSPTIVLRDDEVYLVIGGAGGPTIPTAVAQVMMDVMLFNLPVDVAINRPRMHHQLMPNAVDVEPGFPQVLVDGLRVRGHDVRFRKSAMADGILLGNVQAIHVLPDGRLHAANDKRRVGSPAAY